MWSSQNWSSQTDLPALYRAYYVLGILDKEIIYHQRHLGIFDCLVTEIKLLHCQDFVDYRSLMELHVRMHILCIE